MMFFILFVVSFVKNNDELIFNNTINDFQSINYLNDTITF
jgi:hypothetical protein